MKCMSAYVKLKMEGMVRSRTTFGAEREYPRLSPLYDGNVGLVAGWRAIFRLGWAVAVGVTQSAVKRQLLDRSKNLKAGRHLEEENASAL